MEHIILWYNDINIFNMFYEKKKINFNSKWETFFKKITIIKK